GASLLISTLDAVARGDAQETPQDDSRATYAPRLTKEDGLIDWSHTTQQIHDLVRGLHPWPHAYTFLRGDRLIVHRTNPAGGAVPGSAGRVLQANADALRVATGDSAIDLVELQAEGKRPMPARDFLAGHQIRPGDQFSRQP